MRLNRRTLLAAAAVLALAGRFGPIPVAAPPLHRVPGGRTVTAGRVIGWKTRQKKT